MARKQFPLLFGVLACVFLLTLTHAAHADFDASAQPLVDTFYTNESGQFAVTLLNYASFNDRYLVYTLDTNWLIDPSAVTAEAGKEKKFTLTVQPVAGVLPGAYQIPVTFRSTFDKVGTTQTRNLFVFLRSSTPVQASYVPSVDVQVSFPDNIDPRNKLPIDITMKNRNALIMGNLTLTIQSALFTRTVLVDISSFEEKTLEQLFNLSDLQAPGDFRVNIDLKRGNETITSVVKTFTILGYSTIEVQKQSNQEFFKTTDLLTFTNNGNYEKQQTVRLQVPWWRRMFVSTTPAYTLKTENSITSLTWDIDLKPAEQTNITVVANYRGLALTILAIIIAIILYYVLRSPIISLKRARLYDKGFEGTSEIKVKLFVKNRTSKPVFNLRIIDSIPSIAEVIEEDTLGTIKPTKLIRQEKHGTILKWEIEKLDPYEERIITYKAHAILKIVGDIHLPAFRSKFEAKLGTERVISSNKIELHNDAPAAQEFVSIPGSKK